MALIFCPLLSLVTLQFVMFLCGIIVMKMQTGTFELFNSVICAILKHLFSCFIYKIIGLFPMNIHAFILSNENYAAYSSPPPHPQTVGFKTEFSCT